MFSPRQAASECSHRNASQSVMDAIGLSYEFPGCYTRGHWLLNPNHVASLENDYRAVNRTPLPKFDLNRLVRCRDECRFSWRSYHVD